MRVFQKHQRLGKFYFSFFLLNSESKLCNQVEGEGHNALHRLAKSCHTFLTFSPFTRPTGTSLQYQTTSREAEA